ncbi:hypothetical protein [Sphaerisporangium fuscum]|uniref:hypothetical protein n=1 Tax=Sphaerisporangium fuscum TaxID=2835868 RepID=UPI001BDD3CA8|nr:hypothetical protein [Sphaerisporangium fuscum]
MIRSVIGFVPWIAYGFVATSDNWRYGALVGLAIALVLVVIDRRSGKQWDQMVIETSGLIFFALITAISFAPFGSSLVLYGPALVNAWLAATTWGSLAIRKPFTLGIARTMTPEELWKTPQFYRVNAVITAVWGVSFTVAAIALAFLLHSAPHATTAVITIKVASFVLPAIFTVRYPKIVRARYAA